MENIAFDIWLSGRLDFNEEEKCECFETAKELVRIAVDVRRNGLLSIDDKIADYPDALMRKALQLAVDSIQPEIIQKLLQTHIVANNYRGNRLLQSILIKEGVILIVNGDNPKSVQDFLGVYFGDDFLQEYNDYIGGEAEYIKPVNISKTIAPHGWSGDKLTQEEIDALIIKILKGEI